MRRLQRALALIAVVAAVVLALPASPVSAQQPNDAWSVDPSGSDSPGGRSNFSYTLKPGQTFQDSVWITNVSDRPITFALYARDAYNTLLDGGFALQLEKDTPTDAATWVTLPTGQLTVQPHTRADVPFLVHIPPRARPGDHAAGLIAEDTSTTTGPKNGVGVQVRRRVAARLYVRVAGPLEPALKVESIRVVHHSALLPPITGHGDATIVYRIRNTGNTRMTSTATLKITGFFGRTVHTFPRRAIPELLPGSVIQVAEGFENLPAVERLNAAVAVRGDAVARGSKGFWAVSWLVVALLAAILISGYVVWRRRRRAKEGPSPTPPAHDREPVSV